MAGNPMFTSQKRKFCYKSNSNSSSSTNNKQPAFKRRKDSSENKNDFDDDWDCELTLTQQELKDLDSAATSAYVNVKPDHGQGPQPGTSSAATVLAAPPRPLPCPQKPVAAQNTIPRLVRHSSSTSSTSSSTLPVSSSTTYDSCSSSHSISSRHNSDSSHNNVRIPTRLSSTGQSSATHTALDQRLTEELTHLRAENLKYQALKEDLYRKEGEIKILREDLQRREQESAQYHQEKIQQEDRERSEREKLLKVEVERLNVQLQFKEQEILNLKDTLLNARSSVAAETSSSLSAVTSIPFGASSPKLRKVLVEKPSPRKKFPSSHSFLDSHDVLPKENPNTHCSPKKSTPEVVLNTDFKKKRSLKVHISNGRLHGSQLTFKLLQDTHSNTKSYPASLNNGFVQLLQLHTTQDLQGIRFCRDSGSFLLTPKTRSGSDIQNIMDSANKKALVSSPNLNLAIHGLTQLLISDCVEADQQTTELSGGPSADVSLSHSLLLLPLLADYLGHYCDQLTTNLIASNSNLCGSMSDGSSWKSSSSAESSLDSVTSSVNLHLQDCLNVANQLESLTLVTLRVLNKLVAFCAGLRSALLLKDDATSTEKLACSLIGSLSMKSPNKKNDLSSSALSPQDIEKFDLMNKLFRLANPSSEMLCNPSIVEAALTTLVLLAKTATAEQLERLEPAISRGVIANCLGYETSVEVQLLGLQLFHLLSRSQQIISHLCSDVGNCPLLTMYTMAYRLVREPSGKLAPNELYHTVIEILTALYSVHPSGVACLVETQCPCNLECVKCIVIILYHILDQHQSNCNDVNCITACGKDISSSSSSSIGDNCCSCVTVLCKGVILLYAISQREQNFDFQDVLHKYAILISQLQLMVEYNENRWKTESCALKELWYFVVDSDSLMEDDEAPSCTTMETT